MTVEEADRSCQAGRVLPVPEYDGLQLRFHKEHDLTLYEPHPARLWQYFAFELADHIPGFSGSFRESLKVTVSEGAFTRALERRDVAPRWSGLASPHIYFSVAGYSTDRSGPSEGDYSGLWIARAGDQLASVPITATEKTLAACSWMVFKDGAQGLERVNVDGQCDCGDWEGHMTPVAAFLRLHTLAELGEVMLVPHPHRMDNWWISVDSAGK